MRVVDELILSRSARPMFAFGATRDTKIGQNIALCVANDVLSLALFGWLSGAAWVQVIMMKSVLLTALYLVSWRGATVIRQHVATPVNSRPIVGVLSQEQSRYLHSKFPEENFRSYIAASYVKDVEAAGARVVPIMIGKDRGYYEDIMGKINGVLFPGGATYFNQSEGYADAGQHVYEIAQQLNERGDYFPLFGTCLGFELLIVLASGRGKDENRVRCNSHTNQKLDFTDDFRLSKMYAGAPEDVTQLLANSNVTVNAHSFCIVDENLESHNLEKDWRVTSYSNDSDGLHFIASIEHRRFPFYGVQFHPEKSAFEWKKSKDYPHSAEAVKANRYFMDFFVGECRRNSQSFADVAEENEHLIYKYSPHFTGALGSAYQQCYFFEPGGGTADTDSFATLRRGTY